MTRNNIYRLLLILTVITSSSCNKWLELTPQDGAVREDYWKTKEQVQAAVIGCYYSMLDAPVVENLFKWGELRADMVTTTVASGAEDVDFNTGNILSTSNLTNWNSIYKVINNCNTVIEFAPLAKQSDNTFSQAQLDAFVAEAKGLRALMYFYLLKTFGEVPLQLKAVSSDSKIEFLSKSSKEEVFQQIIKDLSEAEPGAPLEYPTVAQSKGRITRYTINAIQADAYLWMADNEHPTYFQECIKACNKVVNSNRFGLIDGTDQTTWYSTLFYNGNSNESIFELQFDKQKLNTFYDLLYNPTSKKIVASQKVIDEVYTIDYENPLNKDIRADGGSVRAADLVIWKYAGTPSITTIRPIAESYAHWFIYRYSDILLLRAEAYAWTGQGGDAIAEVNKVRARAHALTGTDRSGSINTNDPVAVSDYILEERAREFAFEGKRWFDLLRNAKRNNYAHLDLITSMIAEIAPPDKQQLMIGKYKDVRSHYLPINVTELTADKNLVQNPFYQ